MDAQTPISLDTSLQGRESHCKSKVSCPKTYKKSLQWPWLEPELLDMEPALTMRPLLLPPATSTAMKKCKGKKP